MKQEVLNNLNEFIDFHIRYQLTAYNLMQKANNLGYPGFAHLFQIESADAVVHTRRIMNYLMNQNIFYKVNSNSPADVNKTTLVDLMKILLNIKEEGLAIASKFSMTAQKADDFLTVKFYEWFLIDFYEEINEDQQILDWLTKNESNHFHIDHELSKKSEPDTLLVIEPFSPHKF